MCGIAGIVALSGRPIVEPETRLSVMNGLLRHRGPDQAGAWVSDDGLLGLANTRLSIVGVEDKLKLPLADAERLGRITFNGEIYNYRELRTALQGKGKRFRTHTDTEVLLCGLLEKGLAFVDEADGFWSFAFHDSRDGTLHLVRDLMGEKGLYYAIDDGELVFASEIPPILAVLRHTPSWDLEAIACSFQYRAAPPERTLFEQIRRLPAGFSLSLTPGQRDMRLRRLQMLRPEKWQEFFARMPNLDEVLDVFEERIRLSCTRRIPAEVDYISTLSGGIDSTLINVFLSDNGARRISSLFAHSSELASKRGSDLSEYEASCFTSRKLHTDHHEFAMYEGDSAALHAEDAAGSFDGIFCEAVDNFRELARYAHSVGKRVLVTSDGPDELLGGYDVDLRAYQLSTRFERCDASTKNAMMVRAFDADHMARKSSSLLNWAYLQSEPFAVRPNHGGTRPEVMAKLFGEPLASAPAKQFGRIPLDYAPAAKNLDVSQRMALSYATSSLPDYVNTRSDRGTMRESVELRLPFQAPYLAEMFIALPAQWRFQGGQRSKFILRQLVARYVGEDIAYRNKYGFAQPIWRSRVGPQRLPMHEAVADSPIFREFPFRKGAREFVLGPGQERHCWMAFCLAKSYERFQREFAGPATMALQRH